MHITEGRLSLDTEKKGSLARDETACSHGWISSTQKPQKRRETRENRGPVRPLCVLVKGVFYAQTLLSRRQAGMVESLAGGVARCGVVWCIHISFCYWAAQSTAKTVPARRRQVERPAPPGDNKPDRETIGWCMAVMLCEKHQQQQQQRQQQHHYKKKKKSHLEELVDVDRVVVVHVHNVEYRVHVLQALSLLRLLVDQLAPLKKKKKL